MCHRTTWECPERKQQHLDKDGTPRRNPYRNQIDYVLVRNQHKNLVSNSRSYSGLTTNTDHRLVLTSINLEWYKVYKTRDTVKVKLDTNKLKSEEHKKSYMENVKNLYEVEHENNSNSDSVQKKWDNIKTACLTAANEVLNVDKKQRKSENPQVKALSEKQKKLRNDMNASTSKESRENLRKERNMVLKEIHTILEQEEVEKIETIQEEIEQSKNDSTRTYKAIKALQSMQPKKKLVVHAPDGTSTISDEKQQAEIIGDFFKNIFCVDGEEEIPPVEPCEMQTPFSETEIAKAVKSLKNNKSPGCDDIRAELIKHSPTEIHQGIADLLNEVARSGDYPSEIGKGILVPLPKPGKPQGPTKNLRPIILLSILRKILAICMIRRVITKVNTKIPITQAAYREGRSTTEHVFTFKALAEKAITSSNYEIHLLMLDMSKAFDTVKRATLMEDLKEILDQDEYHMMYILIKDVEYQVRCVYQLSEPIKTNVGTPQGDCLSAILFTLYLVNALIPEKTNHLEDHQYSRPNIPSEELLSSELQDHSYCNKPSNHLNIDQQYADDIGYVSTNQGVIVSTEENVPKKLKKRNLCVNTEKTEKYSISRNGNEKWKRCKYLGTLLDSASDIARRKGLAIDSFNKLKHVFLSKRINVTTKVNIFNTFVSSIFLYNSELWTVTKQLEHKIDVLQRSLLRRILGVRRADRVRNTVIYDTTKTTPWSATIKKRRLSWFGHLLRLPEDTPARLALKELCRKTKRPPGKPRTT